MPRSLRSELLGWLLVPLAAVAAFNVWTTHREALTAANLITDRTLLASARVIAEQVRDNDGSIEALIPPSALEMFASPDRDRVIYRVNAPSGELIAGFPDVASPLTAPIDLQPIFFDARFRIDDVRSVAVAQPVVSKGSGGNALVIVAETLRGRDRLVADLWLKSLRDQTLLLGAAAILMLFGLRRGLAPLSRLRSELLERSPASLRPLATDAMQLELRPLVEALNHALARIQNYVALQRRFIANASHQMRTPLAVLKTQATVGLRETSGGAKSEALAAIDHGLDALSRLVNQLLTLARAEPGGGALRKEAIDFVAVARVALERIGALALDRKIELTFDPETPSARLIGHAPLLQEMVINLVENAIRYTPPGGAVAISIKSGEGSVRLQIEDTGPGIPAEESERVFERFYRIPGNASEGAGLGLAIVREIVLAHDGGITLSNRTLGSGLIVDVILPAPAAPDQPGPKPS